MQEDLLWLGIAWDGPVIVQSERIARYRIADVGEVHAREGSDDHGDGLALEAAFRPFGQRRGCES